MNDEYEQEQAQEWVQPKPPEEEAEEKSKGKKKGKPELPAVLEFPDGTAIAASGCGIHIMQDGKRRWIPDTWTQTKMIIRMDEVIMLFPDQLLAIPEGKPFPSKAPAEPLF